MNNLKSEILAKLKSIKSGQISRFHEGICGNVYSYTGNEYYKTGYIMRSIFAHLHLNVLYPVEHMYLKENNLNVNTELWPMYDNQRDKWDIETNKFALYRYKLLDMMIEKLEKELQNAKS
ncbi:T9SS C-terminal target domain-containing protein [Pectobacterium phage POP12]|nr:T9SS C-terminal target domain-containing protein [Pectobacterium phage POP12]